MMTLLDWVDMKLTKWFWNFQWVWNDEKNIEKCSKNFFKNMLNSVKITMHK